MAQNDLRILYPRYLYKYEETWPDELIPDSDEPYYVELVCKLGVICLHDNQTLHAIYNGVNSSVRSKLKKLPGSKVIETDAETLVYVDLKWARRLFSIMKPKLNQTESKKVFNRLHKNK